MNGTLSKIAYTKIILHASKYPYYPVYGFVIGNVNEDTSVQYIKHKYIYNSYKINLYVT
jgi:hypothetical protein